MGTSQQLYRLQELDSEIESCRQTLQQLNARLGESPALVKARADVAAERQRLEDLKKHQHASEIEADDLSVKLKAAEYELYSGNIRNPKELSNLQHDIELIKAHRSQIEDRILDMMEQGETLTGKVAADEDNFKKLEGEWRVEQQKLAADIERLKSGLAELEQERQLLVSSLDKPVVELYNDLKNKRKTAVAKVTQGTCSGCRIQLPITDLQRVRSGSIVQCSSCGRILHLQ